MDRPNNVVITDVPLKIVAKDSFLDSVLKEGRFIMTLIVWSGHSSSPPAKLDLRLIFYMSFH